MPQQTPTPPAPARLLLLPPELRLEIYSHCTAFTLLLLSQTCTALRAEINSVPDILLRSYGYAPSPPCPSPSGSAAGGIVTIKNIARIQTAEEAMVCEEVTGRFVESRVRYGTGCFVLVAGRKGRW
ncbi:hypothetical protein BJ508DRAFT_38407 [Ascobolus immersus RN42]|uniref:F-box domain-containing protein n=1 Tax=Ascobolus immersus RN42 TaxID=1160509 RepID=A0A3N4IFQ7_ASCIM|nr:hypothetical protein BJ508DRAFT_38407 [Ascobolus immersus RN42]